MTLFYNKGCQTCQMTAALPPQPQKKLQPIHLLQKRGDI